MAVQGVDGGYPLRDGVGVVRDGGVNDVVEEGDVVVDGGGPKAVKNHVVVFGLLRYAGRVLYAVWVRLIWAFS